METVSTSTLYSQGCSLGQSAIAGSVPANSLVVLDFGEPWLSGSTYGTKYWLGTGGTFASTAAIAAAVEQFGKGFYDCTTSSPILRIAVGQNSDSSEVTSGDAAAWSSMVGSIDTWFTQNGYASQVDAAGAIDAEPGFYASASMVRSWAGAFSSSYAFYDFGAATGCSWTGYSAPPGGACNDSWHQDDIWYDSWGAPAAYPLPEVYNQSIISLGDGPSDPNAQQWEMIRRYGNAYKGGPVTMQGSLTRYKACSQKGGCSGTDNSAQTGWTHLYDSVNDYSPTQGNLQWATDIMWGF